MHQLQGKLQHRTRAVHLQLSLLDLLSLLHYQTAACHSETLGMVHTVPYTVTEPCCACSALNHAAVLLASPVARDSNCL